jgi:hypothetical protein
MGLRRTYRIVCDDCGRIYVPLPHNTETPRRARAEAKRHGWQRRNVGAIRLCNDGITSYQEWGPYRDFCAQCLDKMDTPQEGGE